MTNDDTIDGAASLLTRLERATNAHDVDALVACFAPDYRNDTPAHPERSFTGREQVRRNWEQIFAAIPDLTARVLRSAVNGRRGMERVGTPRHAARRVAHVMRGVVIFGVANGLLAWARFYLEPVQEGGEQRRCRGSPAGRAGRPATRGVVVGAVVIPSPAEGVNAVTQKHSCIGRHGRNRAAGYLAGIATGSPGHSPRPQSATAHHHARPPASPRRKCHGRQPGACRRRSRSGRRHQHTGRRTVLQVGRAHRSEHATRSCARWRTMASAG